MGFNSVFKGLNNTLQQAAEEALGKRKKEKTQKAFNFME